MNTDGQENSARHCRGWRRLATVGVLMIGPAFFAVDLAAASESVPVQPAAAAASGVAASASAAAPATDPVQSSTSVAVSIDCANDFNRNKGGRQPCFDISRLSLGYKATRGPVAAEIGIDPFWSPAVSLQSLPNVMRRPTANDTATGIVDNYGVSWAPRPGLAISAGRFSGTTILPSVNDLAMRNTLWYSGWAQTAISVRYNIALLKGSEVRFVAGNGEGENGENLDPQQYFGFSARAPVYDAWSLFFGMSLDGNTSGSQETDWLLKNYAADPGCGYVAPGPGYAGKVGASVQRLAAALVLDKPWDLAPGLQATLAWGRATTRDLDKDASAFPSEVQLKDCGRVDADTFFVEDSTSETANRIIRTTMSAGISQAIGSRFFIAGEYQVRSTDSGVVRAMDTCFRYTAGVCSDRGPSFSIMDETAYTAGGGVTLGDGLKLTLEYYRREFDRRYANFFYPAPDGDVSSGLELFNARVAVQL